MGSGGAFRAVLRDRTLRRLQYAVLGSILGRFGATIALGVWAYDVGGPGLVGLIGFVRLAPGAIVAPFAATLVDRHRRDRVMAVSDGGRAALYLLAAGAVMVEAPAVVVLVLMGGVSVLGAVFEPARSAILPSLVDHAEQLTAANAVSSAVNSCGYFLGPALGGLLLVLTSVEVVLAATALTLVLSAYWVLLLRPRHPEAATAPKPTSLLADLREGVRTVAEDRAVALLVGYFGLQTLIGGAVSVFVVLVALDKLDAGQGWVGILDAAAGLGALIGVAVVSRAGRRLSTGVIVGLLLWGVPLLLVAASDLRVAALVAMLLIGIGDTAIDVSGYTLVQRVVPEALLGRVFGLLEAVSVGGLAVGALLAPLAVALLGLDGALVAFACLPVAGLAGAGVLRRLDVRAEVDERPRTLLRGIPMFGVLPLPTLDGLALALRPVEVADGQAVFHQGDVGDRYYVVDDGELEVRIDGEAIRMLGAGEGFGEIALLRDVTRSATVTARGPVKLLALERDAFLAAVTGHAGAARAADSVVSGYRTAAVPA